MRVYYDTEFIEDGRTIDLVSIGMVAEDGRELYLVSSEFDVPRLQAHPWLAGNVWPYLPQVEHRRGCRCMTPLGHLDVDDPAVRTRTQIARAVQDFLFAGDSAPELWADFAAYDHVALAQLWGTMIDLPAGIPMFTHELQQDLEITEMVNRLSGTLHRGPRPVQDARLHHALADARHARDLGRWVGHQPDREPYLTGPEAHQ